MIDKQFDDILKRKLNDMTETSPSDWSTFEGILDDTQLSFEKSEGDFDHVIQQKLAGMTSATPVTDWSTFEQILDEDQLTDDILDDKVSREMNNMRAPYRQDHWELLHDTLEFQKQRNKTILGYKVIEISLLFILLLSTYNISKFITSTFEVEKPMIYASLDDINSTIEKDLPTENVISPNTPEPSNAAIISSITIHKERKVNLAFENTSEIYNQSNTTLAERNISANIESSSDASEIVSSSLIGIDNTFDSTVQLTDQTEYSSATIQTNHSESSRVMIEISNISTHEQYLNRPLDEVQGITPLMIQPINKTEKSILIYAGLDNNLVNSPFDNIYDTEGFRTYGIGYTAGIEYGIQKENTELFLGLSYSNRAYEPRIIDELTGNPALILYETSLDHIEFDIMSLSIGLKYLLIETDNWAIDMGIGASANIVVNTDYAIETRTIRDGKYVSSRDGRVPFSNLDDKPLHDGIFENGSLKENIYFTTDISLGLHRQLNESTNFTIRPEYSVHSFSDGIGPNNDLINNLSLNLGIKYLL